MVSIKSMGTLVSLMSQLVGNVEENQYERTVIGKHGAILITSLM